MPNEIGFAALLPNMNIPAARTRVDYALRMYFGRPFYGLRGDRRPLGFNPARRLLHIGRTSINADVYFGWADRRALKPGADLRDVEYDKETTVMEQPLRLATTALLLKAMVHSKYRNIYLTVDYPDITDLKKFYVQTNLT